MTKVMIHYDCLYIILCSSQQRCGSREWMGNVDPHWKYREMSKSYPENVRMRGKGRTGITSRRSEKTTKKRSMMSPGPGWMSALDVAVIAHKQSYLQSSHESNHMWKHVDDLGFHCCVFLFIFV
jgi:hypothetical protein